MGLFGGGCVEARRLAGPALALGGAAIAIAQRINPTTSKAVRVFIPNSFSRHYDFQIARRGCSAASAHVRIARTHIQTRSRRGFYGLTRDSGQSLHFETAMSTAH